MYGKSCTGKNDYNLETSDNQIIRSSDNFIRFAPALKGAGKNDYNLEISNYQIITSAAGNVFSGLPSGFGVKPEKHYRRLSLYIKQVKRSPAIGRTSEAIPKAFGPAEGVNIRSSDHQIIFPVCPGHEDFYPSPALLPLERDRPSQERGIALGLSFVQ